MAQQTPNRAGPVDPGEAEEQRPDGPADPEEDSVDPGGSAKPPLSGYPGRRALLARRVCRCVRILTRFGARRCTVDGRGLQGNDALQGPFEVCAQLGAGRCGCLRPGPGQASRCATGQIAVTWSHVFSTPARGAQHYGRRGVPLPGADGPHEALSHLDDDSDRLRPSRDRGARVAEMGFPGRCRRPALSRRRRRQFWAQSARDTAAGSGHLHHPDASRGSGELPVTALT